MVQRTPQKDDTQKALRKKELIYVRPWAVVRPCTNEEHGGNIPAVTLEIIERFNGDAGARQAAEAVCIRDEKPKMNGKDEWTN